MKTAIPYRRFSSKTQVLGNSEARQDKGFNDFLTSSHLQPAASNFHYWDKGHSGYKGKHRDHDFGRLLTDAKEQAWTMGSVVWFEDMDRFSREKLATVLADWDTITSNGYSIHVGSLNQTFHNETPDMERIAVIMKAILAREESEKKAKRLAASWAAKRSRRSMATKTGKLSRHCPCWFTLSADGTHYVFNDVAQLITQAVSMSIQGYGATAIRTTTGLGSGLLNILKSRTLIGEWQPQTRTDNGKADVGDAVADYYPALIDHATFRQLQQALLSRKTQVKRRAANEVNLFTGLLFSNGVKINAMNTSRGETIYRQQDRKGSTVRRSVVETAILDLFVEEITEETLYPPQNIKHPNSTDNLEAQLGDCIEKRFELRERFLNTKANSFMLEMIEELTAQISTLEERIEEAKATSERREYNCLVAVKDLVGLVRSKEGAERLDCRTRLAAAIATLVKRIDLDITSRTSCAITLHLKSGAQVRKGDTTRNKSLQITIMQ